MQPLSPVDAARARSRAYLLFSQVFLHGLTPRIFAALDSLPPLADTLPDSPDFEEEAAAWQHLFGFNVFPFASLFLDTERRTGGPVAQAIQHVFMDWGYPPGATAEPPDHLGRILDLMAYLCAAQAESMAHAHPTDAILAAQADVLDRFLLPWLPPFVDAVQQQGASFYASVSELTLTLAVDHRPTLPPATTPIRLPSPPDVLADPKTSLKDIASFLATPPWSGFFLSRDGIARMARPLTLPTGFGDRTLMLTNVFRASVEYDRFPALVDALVQETDSGQARLASSEAALAFPAYTVPWVDRLRGTRRLLLDLREAQRRLS